MTDEDIQTLQKAKNICLWYGENHLANLIGKVIDPTDRCTECGKSGNERDGLHCLQCLMDESQPF